MRVANTVELKNKTNELLRIAMVGEPVIITVRGKPAAALTRLTEDDLEGFVAGRARGAPLDGRQTPELLRYAIVPSALGPLYVAYSSRGICGLDLAADGGQFVRALRQRTGRDVERDPHPPVHLRRLVRNAVASMRRFGGPIDLALVGPFERRVLEQLRTIPRGEVRTYREIAAAVGYPEAVRAVGNACAKNPVPLLIPCHRVVRSDGTLGGYSLRGGLALKRRLLESEGVNVARLRDTVSA